MVWRSSYNLSGALDDALGDGSEESSLLMRQALRGFVAIRGPDHTVPPAPNTLSPHHGSTSNCLRMTGFYHTNSVDRYF